MISRRRWHAECILMANVFPHFEPFVNGQLFGFRGRLGGRAGQQEGTPYALEIRAEKNSYPALKPSIFITPRVGPNWLVNGALCVTHPWHPARSTFAQLVLYAAAYLEKEKG